LISFDIKRSQRKNLAIYVHRDQRVEVRAPRHVSKRQIDKFVKDSAAWIQRELQRLSEGPLLLRLEYGQGAYHKFLGNTISLHLRQASRNSAELRKGRLHLSLTHPAHTHAVNKALLNWYRQQAAVLFQARLKHWHGRLLACEFKLPLVRNLRIRKMKRSWGSCSRSAEIVLNLWLITQPVKYIDYVIVHELCHLLEFNHSKEFYQLMDRAMAGWKERRTALEASGYPPY